MQVEKFVFGPFAENTYIAYVDTGECIIIDPGTTNDAEKQQLKDFFNKHSLKPVRLINTHCHLDHILGNKWVKEEYGLLPEFHEKEVENVKFADEMAPNMGIEPPQSPYPERYLSENDEITLGSQKIKLIFSPGHSPGHLILAPEGEDYVISGDVIFEAGVGRTDLPGGNYETLMQTIKDKILSMEDSIKLLPGHGPQTTVGFERNNNPFVLAEARK